MAVPALSQMVVGIDRSARAKAAMASDRLPGVRAACSSTTCMTLRLHADLMFRLGVERPHAASGVETEAPRCSGMVNTAVLRTVRAGYLCQCCSPAMIGTRCTQQHTHTETKLPVSLSIGRPSAEPDCRSLYCLRKCTQAWTALAFAICISG